MRQNQQPAAKARPLAPEAGRVYANRGGGKYLCIARLSAAGTLYHHQVGVASETVAIFQNVLSGWTFTAKGIIEYADGTIEWDHSSDGRFEDIEKGV